MGAGLDHAKDNFEKALTKAKDRDTRELYEGLIEIIGVIEDLHRRAEGNLPRRADM